MNHAVHFMVHSQYLADMLHEHYHLPLIRIHHSKNFDSKLQVINASLIQTPVSFRGQGKKLLERNKHLGHNLSQYGMYTYIRTCLHMYVHTYVCIYIHTHVHMYIHQSIQYIATYIYVHMIITNSWISYNTLTASYMLMKND